MYQYSELIKLSTSYAQRMNKLSRRIFGEVVRDTTASSRKVVRLMAQQPDNKNTEKMVSYYPRHVETGLLMMKLREYGLFRDEHQDFKDEMKRLRALRGKYKYSPSIDGWPEGFVRKRKQKKAAA
uniref:Small ribosomal subunit protein mS33 n=1 Tax=Graphocephala atropunctata TaxID=36148 RepID=A0A1B6LG12_9HEMI